MHYLIDGHNLIAKMSSIELGDPNGEAELVLLLRRWTARGSKRRVSIVFDGGLPGGENRLLSTSKVQVVFAPRDRTADDLLIGRIRRLDNPAEYTVVTGDHSVGDVAQSCKAKLISSRSFAQTLDGLDVQSETADQTEDRELSDTEVDEWLEFFQTNPED
jgi:predicted RNA-binding protein with PIN domain